MCMSDNIPIKQMILSLWYKSPPVFIKCHWLDSIHINLDDTSSD